jgi:hypothetical protein
MSPWEKILERPHPAGHFVQLYEADETALCRNVTLYAGEGLRRGDGVLLIVTPQHRELFSEALASSHTDVSAATRNRQLVFCDAQETLAAFMFAGQPNWERFEQVIRDAMRQVQPASDTAGLRAYGEMVGVLWRARQFAAAIRLEQLWNRLLDRMSFSLYCAYAIDVFGDEFELSNLEGVLCTHTHLVPAHSGGPLETALNRSMDEIFGVEANELRLLIKANQPAARAVMPAAESTILWLRKNLPAQATEIVARARRHYDLLAQ